MALNAKPAIPWADLESFSAHLRSSTNILALLGAGLSASSGLPTFRGVGGLWRNHDATMLATPEAFDADPGLVWQFYSYRRHMALEAKPNKAHYALAELAKKRANFITLSQNVDGLSPRAGHPALQLHLLHGSLFDVRCTAFYCDYSETDNFTDPIAPSLAIPREGPQPEPASTDKTGAEAASSLYAAMKLPGSRHDELDISNDSVPLPQIHTEDLPRCPKCKSGLLRPGVVWFGEALPKDTLDAVDDFIDMADKIDLIMVIGTSARVYPAAEYADIARQKGAKVAVINTDRADTPKLQDGLQCDWFFEGDAGAIVPELLRSVIGEV
ncbi:hypothetical protein MMC17_003222 [Xylographa soralifera]|nr:hypothetical protein [Xylographa soralifera]